ncbi:MAG: hypothetical protein AUK16_01050 [Parcubacteria group bacterium CG2_30_44_11]|nr:MAG: hypothetical protein AUK16_01050 [Parcubacteria group bacterium CG2_30_44_11]
MVFFVTLLTLLLPTLVLGAENATDFVPLVGIPYVDTTNQATTLGDYVNGLYWASISIAAVLAFLKITWAGIKYMMSEIVTDKQSAKSDIKGALLGLIIILGAVLVLDTINPSIKKLTALTLVPLTGDVTQPTTGGPVIYISAGGVLTLDPNTATQAEKDAFIADCIRDTNNDGFPDGRAVTFMTKIECQALSNDDAVVNTDENLNVLLTESAAWAAKIAGKTETEIAIMYQQELEQYRQWISNMEPVPPPTQAELDAIIADNGASEIAFIVKDPNNPLVEGALSAYEVRCEFYTGSDNLVRLEDGNYVCLKL